MKNLPNFKYHPDPLKTGSIAESSKVCISCGQARGFIYTLRAHIRGGGDLCPWCIASGEAVKKFNGCIMDPVELTEAGFSGEILEELCFRTPAYECWGIDWWLACCTDACEFHGDATRDELLELDHEGLKALSKYTFYRRDRLLDLFADYRPKGCPAFYRFVCRHCRKVKYYSDHH